ncbi:MAG: KTSC domain-containing protein [Frankiaceae bacterium]|nr:KTSC domain-containing protein [Frankiaceae bacterium]
MAVITMQPLGSRALSAVGYDARSRTLRVRFRHGGLYDYHDVPEHTYEGIRMSPHPWTEWGRHIKESYSYTQVK